MINFSSLWGFCGKQIWPPPAVVTLWTPMETSNHVNATAPSLWRRVDRAANSRWTLTSPAVTDITSRCGEFYHLSSQRLNQNDRLIPCTPPHPPLHSSRPQDCVNGTVQDSFLHGNYRKQSASVLCTAVFLVWMMRWWGSRKQRPPPQLHLSDSQSQSKSLPGAQGKMRTTILPLCTMAASGNHISHVVFE